MAILDSTSPGMSEQGEDGFRRDLGLFSASCVVIGAIIGIGIFFTPQKVAEVAGSSGGAMTAWMLGGVIAVLGALTFAELGGVYAKTGGQFDILRDAYGSLVGFVYVFCNATAVQAGAIAIIAIVSADNLFVALDIAGDVPRLNLQGDVVSLSLTPRTIVASFMIVVLMATNYVGVRWGSLTQNITVVAKVATLLLIIGLAIFVTMHATSAGTPSTVEVVASTSGKTGTTVLSIFSALVPVLFSFGGWQHALWIGGEVRKPKVSVPASILIGVAVVTLVYVSVNWAYLRLLGYEGVVNGKTIAADSVTAVWPQIGRRMIAGAIAFSGFGVLNAQLLSGPRLLCGMARQGRFFSPFARLHVRFRTPYAAILLLGGLGLFLLWIVGSDRTGQLVNGVVMVDAVFFVLTGFALVVLRLRSPAQQWPIRMPLFPLIPIAFGLAESCVVLGAFAVEGSSSAYVGLSWIAAAIICFLIWFRRDTRLK